MLAVLRDYMQRRLSVDQELRLSVDQELRLSVDQKLRSPAYQELRFRANLLLSILLTLDALSILVIVYFVLVARLQMDPVTWRWAVLLLAVSSAFYCGTTLALLRGHYRAATIATVTVALTSVGSAVAMTAGVPSSPALPMLLLPAIISFCLLGPRLGSLIAALIPAACALQWYLSTYRGLQLPVMQSLQSPIFDSLLVNGINYLLVMIVLLVYERINNNLRRERDSERARLAHFATHDDLTGLANRRHFLQRLNEACARCDRGNHQVAVLYIDLNGFKRINDSLGHGAGDTTLLVIAQRLTAMLRLQDLVARLGGDEFAIIIDPCNSPHEIAELCERLQSAISEPLLLDDCQFSIGASIGVTYYPSEGVDIEHVLRHADIAMYAAKRDQNKAPAVQQSV